MTFFAVICVVFKCFSITTDFTIVWNLVTSNSTCVLSLQKRSEVAADWFEKSVLPNQVTNMCNLDNNEGIKWCTLCWFQVSASGYLKGTHHQIISFCWHMLLIQVIFPATHMCIKLLLLLKTSLYVSMFQSKSLSSVSYCTLTQSWAVRDICSVAARGIVTPVFIRRRSLAQKAFFS